jgi:hypothetical protein
VVVTLQKLVIGEAREEEGCKAFPPWMYDGYSP